MEQRYAKFIMARMWGCNEYVCDYDGIATVIYTSKLFYMITVSDSVSKQLSGNQKITALVLQKNADKGKICMCTHNSLVGRWCVGDTLTCTLPIEAGHAVCMG